VERVMNWVIPFLAAWEIWESVVSSSSGVSDRAQAEIRSYMYILSPKSCSIFVKLVCLLGKVVRHFTIRAELPQTVEPVICMHTDFILSAIANAAVLEVLIL